MIAKSLARHVRVVAGVMVGAAITTLISAVAMSPARAELVTAQYTPWSSYLAGWTDEYIPSSDNDCVAGRSTCLRATLKELSRIADRTASNCTHDAIFSRAYVRMTQLYGYTRDIPGYYQDVQYFNHVDAVFAKYYTDSYYNWRNGNRSAVPQSWLIALDAAANKSVTGSGDLLLGMNAHINRDLPYVMAAVGLVAPDGSTRKGDYDAVERWLYDATAPLMAEMSARFDPTLDDADDPFGGGYWATFQMVSGWREDAWRNAEALVSAPTEKDRAVVAANIEAKANAIAEGLLLTESYVPPLSSTTSRDAFCAVHNGDAPPLPYEFGEASPWGYAY